MDTYMIIRKYYEDGKDSEILMKGLTLEEAQEWCSNPETSSSTCKEPINVKRTRQFGPWFDCYTEEE